MDILMVGSMADDCATLSKAIKRWGPIRAKTVLLRLQQLRAAENLETMRALPQAKCHELVGDRQNQIALDVGYPYRLIIEPANDPIPRKTDGGLDWKRITKIKALEVVDYHGK